MRIRAITDVKSSDLRSRIAFQESFYVVEARAREFTRE